MIVTIDGPAGAGKSTVARLIAQKLGFEYLDTGAMYRMITLAGLRDGVDPSNVSRLIHWLPVISIDLHRGKALLEGEDVSEEIRTPGVTGCIQGFADQPLVRQKITDLTRHLAGTRDVVTEGRDQGTVVFPQAEIKFFVTASDEVRAKRRFDELKTKGVEITFDEVLAAQQKRDAEDAARPVGKLSCPPDAEVVDTSGMETLQVVDLLVERVKVIRAKFTT